jgi:outer membrane protein assembly factor BamA
MLKPFTSIMKRKILIIIVLFLSSCTLSLNAQVLDSLKSGMDEPADTLAPRKKEKIKKGWSFGAVPAIGFDSDIGFKYGGLINFYDYGDGTIYPNYKHSLYFEWSNTTKNSGIKQFTYDSKYLIPSIRVSAEASYLTERAMDFYGYNGYEAYYNSIYEDDSPSNSDYISRQYFRQERKLLRLRTDFQGRFFGDHSRWIAGITHYTVRADTIDVVRLNKGKDPGERLPDTIDGGLYGQYAYLWNVIPSDQIHGGSTTFLKGGLVYDTRDNEPNPMKGMWTEVIFFWAPSFLGNSNYSFAKISVVHRQYFTLIYDRLSFDYRLGYQGKLWGKMPAYMLPFVLNGGFSMDRDGLGGSKTLRGIQRNRIVGEDFVFGNLELRWKFLKTHIKNQNIYLALSTFSDFGMITGKYKFDRSGIPAEYLSTFFPDDKEKLHITYGAGLHVALNQNFVVAIDYGLAADKRDGKSGLYIGLNWLF